jgi:hypothetical protein
MKKYFDFITNKQGDAIAGAMVEVFNSNGTYATVYSDNGITVQANPMTTDASGYFDFYVADGRYNITTSGVKITTKTITDVLIVDPLGSLGLSTGASLVGFKQTGTGAVSRTVQSKNEDVVSVFDFMTTAQIADVKAGTALLDVTAAIQAAVNAAMGGALMGATPYAKRNAIAKLVFPGGTYLIASPIALTAIGGLIIEGAGRTATRLRASGTFKCFFNMQGVSHSVFRDMSFDGVGQWAGANFVDSVFCINWDGGIISAGSTYRNKFENLNVFDLQYKWGFDIGSESSTFDVSDCMFEDISISGNRTSLVDATTTKWQEAFRIGSGTSGNILNHFFNNIQCYFVRKGFNVQNVNSVSIANSSGSYMSDFAYKLGAGVLSLSDLRIEQTQHLVSSGSGATYSSNLSISDVVWSPSTAAAVIDNDMLQWGYGGNVSLKNIYSDYTAGQTFTVSGAQNISITIDGVSVVNSSPFTFVVVGTTPVRLFVSNFVTLNSSLGISAVTGPIMLGFNLTTNTLQIGRSGATGYGTESSAMLNCAVPGDSTTLSRGISFRRGSTDNWLFYQVGSDTTNIYLRDSNNAKMHVTYTGASGAGNGTTELNSALKVVGKVGFYNTTPVVQPAANPDTSGATLANLEIEVNELKALLRSVGLMAP